MLNSIPVQEWSNFPSIDLRTTKKIGTPTNMVLYKFRTQCSFFDLQENI